MLGALQKQAFEPKTLRMKKNQKLNKSFERTEEKDNSHGSDSKVWNVTKTQRR